MPVPSSLSLMDHAHVSSSRQDQFIGFQLLIKQISMNLNFELVTYKLPLSRQRSKD